MIPIRYTRNLFLRAICVVYLFAFISFYIQIPGLYGDNGIAPARSVLENDKHKSWSAKVHYQPTLLWLAPYLGLDTQYALDVLALLGSFLAFTGLVSQKLCTIPLFAGLWSLYFSLYQVGQVFVTSQWDDFLLEAGFLSLLVAPLLPGKRRGSKGSPSDAVSLWLVRWLLFRFFVSSSVVKLLSGCPKWWDLSALTYHFQSMVLPSPISWYSHHIPAWCLRLTAVYVNFTEIVMPFLFFVPIRSVRITGYLNQMFLQICIVLTGNFNFANLLVATLLLALLDDQVFFGRSRKLIGGKWTLILGYVANLAIHAALIYAAIVFYEFKINGMQIDSKIAFTKDQFDAGVKQGILVGIYIGIASLGLTVAKAVSVSIMETHGTGTKIATLLCTIFYSAIAVLIFTASTVPFSAIHSATNSSVAPAVRSIHNRLVKLHVVNQYGIFAKMTGVDGRLEVVLEGSDNVEGPWEEYHFLYKPGNVNHSLPFVAPHYPRLDWQMWWASKSTYQEQPWLLSLTHRLLQGRPEVLALLDRHHSPFQQKPPKFIRAILYNYKFTSWQQRWQPTWWKREKVSEYFPAFTKDSPALVDYLRARNLLPTLSKQPINPVWKQILDSVRYVTSHLEATLLLWSVFTAGCAIITTTTKK